MPGLARKLVVCAAVDGLIIQPLTTKGQRPFSPLLLRYGDAAITSVSRDSLPDTSRSGSSFEAFGVVGLISVSKLSFLVTITRRQQVASIFGYPIYVVTEVAITPCSSQSEAADSIRQTSHALEVKGPHRLSDDSDLSDLEYDETHSDEVEDSAVGGSHSTKADAAAAASTFAKDVMSRRGSYGRFAQSWFSSTGWTLQQQKQMGMSTSPNASPKPARKGVPPAPEKESTATLGHAPVKDASRPSTLLPKLLRTLQILFGSSKSFYFSYDVDVTHRLSKTSAFPETDSPLYTRVDQSFFWNRKVMEPFLEAGQDPIALPLMQGFVGQRDFTVDTDPPQKDATKDSLELRDFATATQPDTVASESLPEENGARLRPSERKYLITLISRRSTKRAGLRYLRRGINEDGFVANSVETEQILAPLAWEANSQMHSFLQVRGSIPVFFTQSPYSLKPAPVLQHNNDINFLAANLHLERLTKAYGQVQIVNLVEKHGIEEPVGTRFQRMVERYNEECDEKDQAFFEWFDFHKACRGMKFENVSQLLSILKDRLEHMGSTTQRDGVVLARQNGIIRTNCMDCLDRTNVCQSSFARHVLESQLKADGVDMSAQLDQVTSWFNTLWADNGDAISKQYASTAAMKGDYTRTRKRDYRGALNDLGLSLTRFYSGMVNDFFSQTAIDFLLGNVTDKVFDEFEADMMTKDPAVSVAKMRDQAIDLCHRRVVADEREEFHGGWVLLSPGGSDAVRSTPMEDAILLLTDAALYLCRFDWNVDKVSSFERVKLANITNIKYGSYITSTISTAHMDEETNVGFVVTFQPGKSDFKRMNTRTMSTQGDAVASLPEEVPESATTTTTTTTTTSSAASASRPTSWIGFFGGKPKGPVTQSLAFKAPYQDSSIAPTGSKQPQQTEIQQVTTICAEIERLALESQPLKAGEQRDSIVEKGEIISLETAKRNTGLLEQLGYSIKRLVWA